MTLRHGSRGSQVRNLQNLLTKAGFSPGEIDSVYGRVTMRAVASFQRARGLFVDGVAGPQTLGALVAQSTMPVKLAPAPIAGEPAHHLHPCDPDVWARWLDLVDLLTGKGPAEPVRYGPGRGLWVDDRFVITRGPGGLDRDNWRSKQGRTFPSLHCTGLTNFAAGWLTGRDESYTHSGNIPPLHDLCTKTGTRLHQQRKGKNGKPVAAPYRGYGEHFERLAGKGGKTAILTWPEVLARRQELGTFNFFAQSSYVYSKKLKRHRWKWWHHTGIIFINHADPARPIKRIAADGYAGTGRIYSGTPLDVEVCTTAWAARVERTVKLQIFRLRPDEMGNFSTRGAPAPVILEAA